jgi:hypothetical protein
VDDAHNRDKTKRIGIEHLLQTYVIIFGQRKKQKFQLSYEAAILQLLFRYSILQTSINIKKILDHAG